MDAVEDYLESCAQVIVDIEVVESLLRPENHEVFLRYVLKHATIKSESPNHFVARRKRWSENQGRDGARQENGQNEWHDIEYQGAGAKAPPCPGRTLQTPLPQQSSSSVAFENLAKEMLRYLDNGDDVKVGWFCLCKSVFPVSKWPSRREVKMAARFLKYFDKKKTGYVSAAGPDGRRSGRA